MPKKAIGLFIIFAFVVSLAGCATTRKNNELENQGLKNQISVLEAQIQSKDEEISSLREALAKAQTQETIGAVKGAGKKSLKVIPEDKFRPSSKHIQMALRNAGYYSGRIDMRLGKQSKQAIKEFQKANNLKETGRVDRETWSLLKEHLYKKVK